MRQKALRSTTLGPNGTVALVHFCVIQLIELLLVLHTGMNYDVLNCGTGRDLESVNSMFWVIKHRVFSFVWSLPGLFGAVVSSLNPTISAWLQFTI